MLALLLDLVRDEEGTTPIEYSMIAALIGVVILASLMFVGDSMSQMYSDIATVVFGVM